MMPLSVTCEKRKRRVERRIAKKGKKAKKEEGERALS